MSRTLTDLIQAQHDLQVESFGISPRRLEGEAFTDYMRTNVLAAQVELAEFIQELPWKPWKHEAGRPDEEARQRAVMELIDTLHFLLNLFVALRADGDELSVVYELKRTINENRQARLRAAERIGG